MRIVHLGGDVTNNVQTTAAAGAGFSSLANAPAATEGTPRRARIRSLDVARGVVMVLMAIDHVRLYGGVPTGGDAGHFLTRWITHFCAPCFVFFAGTSAFFHGRKLGDTQTLSHYLVKRGLFLVLLELTVVRLFWTFNVGYSFFTLAGVIWMLGWCMVITAALVKLPVRTIAIVGLAIMLFQSVFHPIATALPSLQWLWRLLYLGGTVAFGHTGFSLEVLYNIVPWVGVMAAGYAFGSIMAREPADRDRLCLRIGLTATVLFLILGTIGALRAGPDAPPLWVRILNQNKYRDSQVFLLMTLGPAIALLPYAERARGRIGNMLTVYGRAPLFYYVLHILFIHLAATAVFAVSGYNSFGWFATAPYAQVPEAVQWSLPMVYLVWAAVVTLLYRPCRWYAEKKMSGGGPAWLAYF